MTSFQRIMVFIDGLNLFRGFKSYAPNTQYSILKIINTLTDSRNLIRPYYFVSEPVPPNPKQMKFFNGLRYDGVDVTAKTLKNRSSSKKCPFGYASSCVLNYQVEKGVDVSLVSN
jgi:hypothetical protein